MSATDATFSTKPFVAHSSTCESQDEWHLHKTLTRGCPGAVNTRIKQQNNPRKGHRDFTLSRRGGWGWG